MRVSVLAQDKVWTGRKNNKFWVLFRKTVDGKPSPPNYPTDVESYHLIKDKQLESVQPDGKDAKGRDKVSIEPTISFDSAEKAVDWLNYNGYNKFEPPHTYVNK